MSNRRCWMITGVAVTVALIGLGAWLLLRGGRGTDLARATRATGSADVAETGCAAAAEGRGSARIAEATEPVAPAEEKDETAEPVEEKTPKTAEELAAEAEEAKVDAFDNLTDAWMEPRREVTMKEVDAFVKTFRSVPKSRQDECIHRALNLIPDENVLLLAGILMDKSFDREILETVYNDILNRDEDVKKPILELVYKDKTHPCWADTAWIFDVTGETPATNRQ